MSINEELNRLTQAKIEIKGVLDRLGVTYSSDKLNSLAEAMGTVKKVEARQENGVVTVPVGYIAEEQTFAIGSELSTGFLINDGSGNVYFQAVKEVNGEIVADGDPVLITDISIPNTGGVVTPEYPNTNETALITGYIVNNGDGTVYFQRVTATESGTADSGDPVAVESVELPITGVDDPSYAGAGSTSTTLYRCAIVDSASKTWRGYKAVLTGNVYSFEDSVTLNLKYSEVTPLVGGIYPDGALFKVEFVNTSSNPAFLEDNLKFFASLDNLDGWYCETVNTVADGNRRVAEVYNLGYAKITTNPGVPLGSSQRSLSIWVKSIVLDDETSVFASPARCGYGTEGDEFAIYILQNTVKIYVGDSIKTITAPILNRTWQHHVVTYDGQSLGYYLDGDLVASWNVGEISTTWEHIYIGNVYNNSSSSGYFADFYIFDKSLSNDEIKQLYNKRTV